jgi:hypothetical protein
MMSRSKLDELGWRFNVSHLRYCSLLTAPDDTGVRMDRLNSHPTRTHFPQRAPGTAHVHTIR